MPAKETDRAEDPDRGKLNEDFRKLQLDVAALPDRGALSQTRFTPQNPAKCVKHFFGYNAKYFI